MRPVNFPQSNHTFHRPSNMTEEECGSLKVYDAGDAFLSCWQLSPEEVAEVQRTGCVWLWVYGRGHPPVAVEGSTPFKEG